MGLLNPAGDPLKLAISLNLSDVGNSVTARANLGLDRYCSDATTLIAALASAAAAGGGRIVVMPGTYAIVSPLVISSGTWLDCRPGVVIQTAASANINLLQSYQYSVSGAGRDTDIRITGGQWIRGTDASVSGNAAHTWILAHVDRLVIEDSRFQTRSGKYSIYLADVTDFTVRGVAFDSYSDGLHVTGPAARGSIQNIHGNTGDDFVALITRDYPAYEITYGDITDIGVANLYPNFIFGVSPANGDGGNAFRFAGSATAGTYRNIVVSGIYGIVGRHGVACGDDTAQANTSNCSYDDLTIRDLHVKVGSVYSQVYLNPGGGAGSVVIDRVRVPGGQTSPVILVGQAAATAPVVALLTIRDLVASETPIYTTAKMVQVQSGVTVNQLVIDGAYASIDAINGGSVFFGNSGTVINAVLHACRIVGANSVYYTNSGGVSKLTLSGGTHLKNCAYGVLNAGTAALTVIVSAWNFEGTTSAVHASGTGACAIRVTGSGFNKISGTSALSHSASQPISVNSRDYPASVDLLTPSSGDQATNTNASLAVGLGPATYNGASWINQVPFLGTAIWDAPSVASGASTSTTVTVTGAAVGDLATVAHSVAVPAGCLLTAQVTASNTVTVTLLNLSGSAVDLASGTLTVKSVKT